MKRTLVEYNYTLTMENGEVFNIKSLKSLGVRKLNTICKEKGSEYKSIVCTTESHTYELSDEKFIEVATRIDW